MNCFCRRDRVGKKGKGFEAMAKIGLIYMIASAVFLLAFLDFGFGTGQDYSYTTRFSLNDVNTEGISSHARLCIKRIGRAQDAKLKMYNEGLATTRVNDTILIAEGLFRTELDKEKRGDNADYKMANEKADEAIELADEAFQASDELSVLKEEIDTVPEEIDTGPVLEVYEAGMEELKNQRYKLASEKVEEGYEKLVEVQSMEARAGAMYSAASKTLYSFAFENRIIISMIVGIPLILYIVFRDRIKRHRIARKIGKMKLEINVLEGEVKKAQQEYFVDGNIGESSYQIKQRVFGQMIRDLNRQIGLSKEEIEKTKKVRLRRLAKGFMKKEREENSKAEGNKKGKGKKGSKKQEGGNQNN